MPFKKYPSIENSYRNKEIQWWLSQYPELAIAEYVIEEKLHGANFSLEFNPDGEWFPSKRSGRIEDGESFNNCQDILARDEYQKLIQVWTDKAVGDEATYHLYGELFGAGVQSGVDYGPEKRILFYDLCKDEEMQPPGDMIEIMKSLGMEKFLVPVVGTVEGLENAMQFSIEFNSKEGPADASAGENLCEGVVIKPAHKVFSTDQGSVFMLKNKNKAFEEKQKTKDNNPPVEIAPEVQAVRDEFESYLTEERLQGIFSKEGEIDKPDQIGKYIRLFIDDAREDFLKDHRDALQALDKDGKKYVFNVSKLVVEMLKKYL